MSELGILQLIKRKRRKTLFLKSLEIINGLSSISIPVIFYSLMLFVPATIYKYLESLIGNTVLAGLITLIIWIFTVIAWYQLFPLHEFLEKRITSLKVDIGDLKMELSVYDKMIYRQDSQEINNQDQEKSNNNQENRTTRENDSPDLGIALKNPVRTRTVRKATNWPNTIEPSESILPIVRDLVIENLNEIFIPKESIKNSTPKSYSRPKVSNQDYIDSHKYKQDIGSKGELFVLKYEMNELEEKNFMDLANKVRHVSMTTDSLGYDILSYDIKGNEKYIEVKTSTQSHKSDFFLSENEMNNVRNLDEFFIYRVFNFDIENETGDLYIIDCKKEFDNFFSVNPTMYRVSPKK